MKQKLILLAIGAAVGYFLAKPERLGGTGILDKLYTAGYKVGNPPVAG